MGGGVRGVGCPVQRARMSPSQLEVCRLLLGFMLSHLAGETSGRKGGGLEEQGWRSSGW